MLKLGELPGAELALQAREASGECRESLWISAALCDVFQQLRQPNGRLPVERAGAGLILFADAHGIDDEKQLLRSGAGGHGLELVRGNNPDAAPFHLFEVTGGLNIAKKENALNGFHVGAG